MFIIPHFPPCYRLPWAIIAPRGVALTTKNQQTTQLVITMSREKTPGDQKVLEGLKVSKDQHNPHSPGDPKEKDTKDHKSK